LHEALRVAISPPVCWDLDHAFVLTASISLETDTGSLPLGRRGGIEAFLGAIPRASLEAMRRGQRAAGGNVGSHHRHTVAWSV
jgi:hypothetical protein